MDLANKIDHAMSIIANAQEELKQGNLVPLRDFEKVVKSIQDDVTTSVGDNPALYADRLATLAESLRQFEIDLRALQADVKYELMSLSQKQKAARSYQTTNHSAPDKKEE